VREGEPSRTAFGAAVLRALHPELDRPVVFDDPLAWPILGDREQIVGDLAGDPTGLGCGSSSRCGTGSARTRWLRRTPAGRGRPWC
jgi:O-methyltransferase involved in polyketide biosynthesis